VAQNFLPCDREQELLLPPSLREWLPEDHLAWFVVDAVGEMDLSAFCNAYREDYAFFRFSNKQEFALSKHRRSRKR
jgi:hypothetical protein